jgi:hypothetical protein
MSNCAFESRTDTSSATICKHCGKERFEHITTFAELPISKQTAVEWFEDQVGHNSLMALKEFNEIFEKAKEMEKEQRLNQNKTELNDALREFQKKYPSVTSGDLQTFILGWQAAQSNPI